MDKITRNIGGSLEAPAAVNNFEKKQSSNLLFPFSALSSSSSFCNSNSNNDLFHFPVKQMNNLNSNDIRSNVGSGRHWTFEAGGKLEIKGNVTLKIVSVALIILLASTIIYYLRLKTLEERNISLENKIDRIEKMFQDFLAKSTERERNEAKIEEILKFVMSNQNENKVPKNNNTETEDDDNQHPDEDEKSRFKRDLRNLMKNIKDSPDTFNQSFIKNEDWEKNESSNTNSKPGKTDFIEREGDKGKRHMYSKVMRLQKKYQLLKNSLRAFKIKIKSQKTIASSLHITNVPKSIYLVLHENNVDITKKDQHIGPWYKYSNSSADLGFNGQWLDEVELDDRTYGVKIKSPGLYLIYSQVLYRITYAPKEKPAPMGYKIFVKKNEKSNFIRPFPIAECVPSFPSTMYQTCYTSVCWYLEPNDILFLTHFKASFPIIDGEEQGRTFLGLVKL